MLIFSLIKLIIWAFFGKSFSIDNLCRKTISPVNYIEEYGCIKSEYVLYYIKKQKNSRMRWGPRIYNMKTLFYLL